MSIFTDHSLPCPGCNTPVEYEVVQSVNVDRRPDLRVSILDGTFQLKECASCGTTFRVEPEFIYMDQARRQYVGVWPASKRGEWQEWAARTRATFDDALGLNAPGAARKIGEKLEVRAVFGWPALVEKLLARQAGIDDRTLESAKLAVLRAQEETPAPGRLELRMVAEEDGDPVLAWIGPKDADEDAPAPMMRVPRQLLDDIEAEPTKWKALRDLVSEGDVVDFQRGLLVT